MRLTHEDTVVQEYLNDESEELETIISDNITAQANQEPESHLEMMFLTTWEDQIHGCLDYMADNNVTGQIADRLIDALNSLGHLYNLEPESVEDQIEVSLAILRTTKDAYQYSVLVEQQLRATL